VRWKLEAQPVNDYASARPGTKILYRTPAQTLRRYLASGLADHPGLRRLTYERRGVFTPAGDQARFNPILALTVPSFRRPTKTALLRTRNTGASKYWVVSGSTIRGK
jgi:hypothetical protein